MEGFDLPSLCVPDLARLSVSILEGGGRLGLECLLLSFLSYFRVGDNPSKTVLL